MQRMGWAVSMSTATLLCACLVQPPPPKPGEYASYREMALDRTKQATWRAVPPDLAQRAWTCFFDTKISYFTPGEMKKADSYARGDDSITTAELWQIEQDARFRMGGEAETEAAMSRICPAVVADLKTLLAATPPNQ